MPGKQLTLTLFRLTKKRTGSQRLWAMQIATVTMSRRWGWDRLAIVMNPGAGQQVALARTLGLCKTQPLGFPQPLQPTIQPNARGSGGPWTKVAIYLLLHVWESDCCWSCTSDFTNGLELAAAPCLSCPYYSIILGECMQPTTKSW